MRLLPGHLPSLFGGEASAADTTDTVHLWESLKTFSFRL
jgi:hypothetical protein